MRIKRRKNWDEAYWAMSIMMLPDGLTLTQAAKRLGKCYPYASIKLKQHGYKILETRGGFKGKRKLTPAIIRRIDWSKSLAALGRKYDVSRERMRQVRNEQSKPKVNGRKP